jgi:C-terminal processing protease CtpA/Prc
MERCGPPEKPLILLTAQTNKFDGFGCRDIFQLGTMLNSKTHFCTIAVFLAALVAGADSQAQQKLSKNELELAREMLQQVKDAIEKNYYDPTFHGFDLDGRFKEADQKLGDATSFGMGVNVIGWAVEGLRDTHTRFIPPMRNVFVYSGWQMEMVGQTCMISAVEPNSDAWKRGLRPGDVVLKVEEFEPNRATIGQIRYTFGVLVPQTEYHLLVSNPAAGTHSITTQSRLITIPRTAIAGGTTLQQLMRLLEGDWMVRRSRVVEVNDNLMIWKLPAFRLTESEIKHQLNSARKHDTLILDLRDNSGGDEDDLRWMIGSFFDHDIAVGEMIQREKHEPLSARSLGKQSFTGKLYVLVNNSSASAAEIFARTVQLQKRGTVMGDGTAGAVGRGKPIPLRGGPLSGLAYSLEVTVARLKLPDGTDLEGQGVKPDLKMIPRSLDLVEQRDPVLSAAAQLAAGVPLSPEEAGKMFPVEWPTY